MTEEQRPRQLEATRYMGCDRGRQVIEGGAGTSVVLPRQLICINSIKSSHAAVSGSERIQHHSVAR